MAIAALLLWMCTAAVGGYLLATSTSGGSAEPAPAEPAPAEPARVPAADSAESAAPVRARDRFDPPSLAHAKGEPLPGMRALAEFAHPALAMIGFGVWLAYVMSRDRVFAAIGFGVLLGAIAAGLSWVTANTRAAKRAKPYALSVTRHLLALHAVGAALTLLIAALITARA